MGDVPNQDSVKAKSDASPVKIVDIQWAIIQDDYACTLIRIATDTELVGLGEAIVKLNPQDLPKHIERFKALIKGEDPSRVEYLLQKMMATVPDNGKEQKTQLGIIAGIETALWDLAGKIQKKPVHDLLGKKLRDEIFVYYDVSPAETPKTNDPELWAKVAIQVKNAGFKAIKFDVNRNGGTPEEFAAIANAVRAAIGPEMKFGVDFHWMLTPAQTDRFMKLAEPAGLWFVEDPMKYQTYPEHYRKLTTEGTVPILALERIVTRREFTGLIQKGICTIASPDAQYIGGILEMKRYSEIAESHGLSILPHNMSSPVGTIAQAHACATIRRFIALENACAEGIVKGFKYENGHIRLTDKPGLGIELDEDYCRKHLMKGTSFFGGE